MNPARRIAALFAFAFAGWGCTANLSADGAGETADDSPDDEGVTEQSSGTGADTGTDGADDVSDDDDADDDAADDDTETSTGSSTGTGTAAQVDSEDYSLTGEEEAVVGLVAVDYTWTSIPGATYYELKVATDAACTTVQSTLRTSSTTATVIPDSYGTFYICVQAFLGDDVPVDGKSIVLTLEVQDPVVVAPPQVVKVFATPAAGLYRDGAEISLTVRFSKAVVVTGQPLLELETGLIDRSAVYTSGSGTTDLVFTYTVVAGDAADPLDYRNVDALKLNGGTLGSAVLALPMPGSTGSLGFEAAIAVDTAAPATPGAFTATPGVGTVDLDWQDVSDATGYLLVVGTAAVGFAPTDGQAYASGAQGSDTIIYAGSSTDFAHASLLSSQNYYYAVFAHDAAYNYSSSAVASATPMAPPPFGRVDRVGITNDVMSVVTHEGYLYAGTWGKTIEKIRLSDFAYVATLTPSGVGGNWLRDAVVDAANDIAYFVGDGWPTQVVKVDLSTFTVVTTLSLPNAAGKREAGSLVIHEGFLYVGGNDGWANGNVAFLMKVDLSDFSYVGALSLLANEAYVGALAVDGPSDVLYAAVPGPPGKIVKIDLASFTRVGTFTFDAGEDDVQHGCFVDGTRGHLVCGIQSTPAKVVRIDLSTFTRDSATTLTVADVVCAAFDEANGLAYFGVNAAPARVVKVGLDALTEIGTTADFGAGEDYTPDCTRDPGDGSLYMGVMGSDSGVVKVAP